MSPVNAAEIAAQKGVTIHTIGVGDPSGRGDDRVDLQSLQEIAARTGGAFYFADDSEGLTAIYDEIEKLNPRITETVTFQPRQPKGWIAFAVAAVLAAVTSVFSFLAAQRKEPV
jgi:Ca-activated chloride channel family protein